MADRVFRIEPVARAYAWGSPDAIPAFLGAPATGAPVAELWFGAHPDSPSLVDGERALDSEIAADPAGLLGAEVAAEFGNRLPFLLKLLAAAAPLSIQVHPTLAQARAGYAAEQARGLAADAPDRNYRDPNHKPELLCALTEFDALCGFRPVDATVDLLAALDVAALAPVRLALAGPDPLRSAFRLLLDWPAASRDELIAAVRAGCARLTEPRWRQAADAVELAAQNFPGDIGAVLTLLLNAVRLQPGEAIFLGAGNVHAYLGGLGVEIMANSDNVLRCGLTPKHIDAAEVLRVAEFAALAQPRVLASAASTGAAAPGERVFRVPVPDFELSIVDVDGPVRGSVPGPQILLSVAGEVTVDGLALTPGQAVFVAAGQPTVEDGRGTIFRATTGQLVGGR